MTTHEVLVAARNLIDREGWAQDPEGYSTGRGPTCAFGACYVATRDSEVANAQVVLQRVLAADTGERCVVVWNDAPERTKEEVLALFDRAIAETAPPPADPFTAGPVGRASFREPVRS